MNKLLRKIGSVLLPAAVISLFLAGCWDQVEIEDRALVLGLSIDTAPPEKAAEEEQVTHLKNTEMPKEMISITAQIAVPGRVPLGPGSGGSQDGKISPVWVVTVLGHSLDDAMNNLQQQIADPRYLVHLRVIVISQDIARGRMDDLDDYLRRNPEVRRRTWLLVSEGRASQFMDVKPPLQRVPTLYVLSMMEKAVTSGKFPPDYIGTYWSADSKWGQSAYLPYVALRNKENILINGLAYFSQGKMINTTQPLEIGAFMAVEGMDPGGYSTLFKTKELGMVMTKINERYTKARSFIRDGKPVLSFDINFEGDLDEHYNGKKPADSTARLHEIEREFERNAKGVIRRLIRQTQKDHADIFGMGEIIRAHHPEYWRQHIHNKSDWEELYGSITVDFNLTLHLRRVGLKKT
ncbi:spore gernimation protein GerC [Paenibacillus sp. P3E]|uniref:Ger(x)C family spore germination protein n=1 Tax=unclassified Paenibacillus TaxID=185978 RepID=UPI00093C471C|nr:MULTISPECIES: Ger(x)C family spore germination protein [unclassified Paenibacillus]OKP81662.1 spore gernimation protein GerC [Paenibacillus sp. P3E]OKP89497.1 spore gernimation protein GerC [Paenibacillus sp. P32E]